MTALITIRQAGTVIACDRGCYNAKHKPCDCQLCGGVNHGIGLERATANTRRLAPKWVEAAGEGAEVELDPSVQQDPLFIIGDQPMYVALTGRNGADVTVRPAPDFADTFALIVVGDRTAKLDDDQARQIRDGLTDWLIEIGADNP